MQCFGQGLRKFRIFANIRLRMKSFLTILLIAGIIMSAGISLLMMNHHGNCIASSVAGLACPEALNPLAFFGIHLNFLKNFSEGLLTAVSAIIFLAFVYALDSSRLRDINRTVLSFFNAASPDLNNTSLNKKLIFWLSLCENSPAIS